MKNFVDSSWVFENLDNDKLVVLDCRGDLLNLNYGKAEYDSGHIKGAVFMDIKKDLSSEQTEHGGRNPLPEVDEFKSKLESLGIGNDTLVIAYDEQRIASAARLCWMLRYIGHNNNYILNGGIKKWISDGYPIEKDSPVIKKNKLDKSINKNIIADIKKVKENLYKNEACLIDSRTEVRYRGEVELIDPAAGHIPGAVNFYWKNYLRDDGTVKEIDELKEAFKNLVEFSEVIVYCGSGIDAAFNFMLLEEAGISSRLYVGSFSDWITYPENKIIGGE